MERLRPDDHFMIVAETDATPMHIGALILLDTAGADGAQMFQGVRDALLNRLPATLLSSVLLQAPFGFDADVWAPVSSSDLDAHIVRVPGPMSEAQLLRFVADQSLQRLALTRAPFKVHVVDALEGGRSALLIRVHHAVTDGVGFQTLLDQLSDGTTPGEARRAKRPPPAPIWLAQAALRFWRERGVRQAGAARKSEAIAARKALPARARTPVLKLSGATSAARIYAALSLPLASFREVGAGLSATVNDVFLAVAASALRDVLLDLGDLPDTPLVANAARSYRRPEHGSYGNRIVALNPQLATHLTDPVERLRAIQASMAQELERSRLEEQVLDQPERPFGARDRRAKFAARTDGAAILPGNVTLSNVPGPKVARSFAGYAELANHPTPLLGAGRFLNITSRRRGEMLDLGIMADPTKLADLAPLTRALQSALDSYLDLARRVEPMAAVG